MVAEFSALELSRITRWRPKVAKINGETKGKWRKSPARFSKEAFPWTTSFRNMNVLAVKGKKMQARVVNAHFGLLLSSSSTKVKTSEMTSIAGKMPLRTMYRSACPLLTTFLSFGFLWRNPGFLSSAGGEDDSEPELERRRRRLQQAEDPQRGIVGSQFRIFTSSGSCLIRFENNCGRFSCQSVDSAALLSSLSTTLTTCAQGAAISWCGEMI